MFQSMLNNDDTVGLGLKYAMYRDTLTCLYKKLNGTTFFKSSEYDLNALTIKEKIAISVYLFINMDDVFLIQDYIQTYLLSVNCVIVVFNVCMVIFRIVRVCLGHKNFGRKCVYLEVYFSFFLDLVNAVVGAISYFSLNEVVTYTNTVLDTGCMGNYEGAKLDAYAGDLFSTADQNFQMFLVMVMKLLLIVINIFYYIIVKKCKITCSRLAKLIYENIQEGDDENSSEGNIALEDKAIALNNFYQNNINQQDYNSSNNDNSEKRRFSNKSNKSGIKLEQLDQVERLECEGYMKNNMIDKERYDETGKYENNKSNGKELESNAVINNNNYSQPSEVNNNDSFNVNVEYVVNNKNVGIELTSIKEVDFK
jgi:hypothetical protein